MSVMDIGKVHFPFMTLASDSTKIQIYYFVSENKYWQYYYHENNTRIAFEGLSACIALFKIHVFVCWFVEVHGIQSTGGVHVY